MRKIPCSFTQSNATDATLSSTRMMNQSSMQLSNIRVPDSGTFLDTAGQSTVVNNSATVVRSISSASTISQESSPEPHPKSGQETELCNRYGNLIATSSDVPGDDQMEEVTPTKNRPATELPQAALLPNTGSDECRNLSHVSPSPQDVPAFSSRQYDHPSFVVGRGIPALSLDTAIIGRGFPALPKVPEKIPDLPLNLVPAPLHSSGFITDSSHIVGEAPVDLIDYSCESEGEFEGASEGEASFVGTPITDDPEELRVQEEDPHWIEIKAAIISKLLDLYLKSLGPIDGDDTSRTGSETSDAPRKATRAKAPDPQTPSSGEPSRKRQRASGENQNDVADDERDGPQPQIGAKRTPKGDGRILACHYCKHDPYRYSERNTSETNYRHCSSVFATELYRLKQHLYR